MESFQLYKGYGIRYYMSTGVTCVEDLSKKTTIKRFECLCEQKGIEKAKQYIDKLVK